jgi:hypothetical protein
MIATAPMMVRANPSAMRSIDHRTGPRARTEIRQLCCNAEMTPQVGARSRAAPTGGHPAHSCTFTGAHTATFVGNLAKMGAFDPRPTEKPYCLGPTSWTTSALSTLRRATSPLTQRLPYATRQNCRRGRIKLTAPRIVRASKSHCMRCRTVHSAGLATAQGRFRD